jgi:osmotically-inducible protein OsmY
MVSVLLCLIFLFLLSPTLAFALVPIQATAQEQAKGDGNDKIQDNLQSVLQGDPLLSGANVEAQVDDQSIILSGTVESYAQHQRVLQLVEPYARWRKVVDRIKVGSTTRQS